MRSQQAPAVKLRDCFLDPLLEVMNFLNEVVLEYPHAISFAPGRPSPHHFQVENSWRAVQDYVAAHSKRSQVPETQVWQDLGQYGRTAGIIADLISQQLANDESIHVSPESIMVTVGAQEAMAVLLAGLFDPLQDILLVSDPTYVGITGLARVFGIRIMPVPMDEGGLDPKGVEQAIKQCLHQGRPTALYDIPDFNNPLGTTLSLERRMQLLEICQKYGVLIIEDNPYGMYRYDGTTVPAIKTLDVGKSKVVLYVGSFAKTLFPGLRVGYLVADQEEFRTRQPLAKELTKIKSLLTVNTSSVIQAVVGGMLMAHECSLRPIMAPKIEHLRRNRDVMLECLSVEFAEMEESIRWSRPSGGFFLTIHLPFGFGKEELRHCASEYGVIVMPMRFFSLGDHWHRHVRLSFSYVNEEEIRTGLKRFSAFVKASINCHAAAEAV